MSPKATAGASLCCSPRPPSNGGPHTTRDYRLQVRPSRDSPSQSGCRKQRSDLQHSRGTRCMPTPASELALYEGRSEVQSSSPGHEGESRYESLEYLCTTSP